MEHQRSRVVFRSVAWAALALLTACGGGQGDGNPIILAQTPQTPGSVHTLSVPRQAPATTAAAMSASERIVIQVYQALYGKAPSNAELVTMRGQVGTTGNGFAWADAQALSAKTLTDAQLSTQVLTNLAVTPSNLTATATFGSGQQAFDGLQRALSDYFSVFAPGGAARGTVIAQLAQIIAGLENDTQFGVYGKAASAFNQQVAANYAYASDASHTVAAVVDPTQVTAVVVASVVLSPGNGTVDRGSALQWSATPVDASGKPITGLTPAWASANPSVATVASSGVVTGVASGSAQITATVEGKTASSTVTVTNPDSASTTVKVDAANAGAVLRDLLGANKKPTAQAQTPGVNWNAATLYPAFGISQVRLHDSGVDLCSTYTAATKVNAGVTPNQTVSGCTLSSTGGASHFTWTPVSSLDADLNNPANYDFTSVDESVLAALATGAGIYLRLGESFNGPNDTADPVAWAKVATNVYKHVLGVFKPSAGIAVKPVFVEVFNEPDGGFWRGQQSTFNTLFVETVQRVRAAAAAANTTVTVGGAGFTRSVLTSSNQAGNAANGFIAAVGASNLDFYSAHWYDRCASATLASSASFLRSLRALVDTQGGSGKPLHITEWNVGLGAQCGNAFFAEQRTQSFDSGVLTLMQDPAQNVTAAHFYAAMPIMALFDFSSVTGSVRINPSAWAFWAHARLKGAKSLSTQVCPDGGSCAAGYASEGSSVVALSGKIDAKNRTVVTNDSANAVTYRLQVSGLTQSTVTATIETPPSGARDLPAPGNPSVADATALASLLASTTKDTRAGLIVKAGQVQLTVVVPAYSLQVIEMQAP